MADSEPKRRAALASVRPAALAQTHAARPDGRAAAIPALHPVLEAILEILEVSSARRPHAAAALAQRLGDARTLGLIELADPLLLGTYLRDAVRLSEAALRRIPRDAPDSARRRLELVRAAGRLRLGQILIAQGLIAPRRLEAALEAQKASGRRIGAELVACGQLVAREVAEALWMQHKLVAAALAVGACAGNAETASAPRLIHAK